MLALEGDRCAPAYRSLRFQRSYHLPLVVSRLNVNMLLLRNIWTTALPLWFSIDTVAVAAVTSLNLTRPSAPESFFLGINCRGNFWCPWLSRPSNHILQYLLEWISADMNDKDIYLHEQHIACTTLYDGGRGDGAAFCVFTQGRNTPPQGINGSEIKRKLSELRDHGCFACGSVPLGDSNDPNTLGILALNHVPKIQHQCWTVFRHQSPICPPFSSGQAVGPIAKPPGTPPAFQSFNPSAMESTAQLASRQKV